MKTPKIFSKKMEGELWREKVLNKIKEQIKSFMESYYKN